MYLANNIRTLRKNKGITQEDLAATLGYKSFTTVQKWEKGIAEPPLSVLRKLSELFRVELYDLTETDLSRQQPQASRGISIPVLGKVAAGLPIEAIENIIDYEEISREQARYGEYFGLMLKGHSMEPRMCEGDIVIVRKQENVNSGEIAIVLVNGNEATCKKIRKTGDGIMLIPLNPNYDPLFYNHQEIEELPVRIIGKVVELRAKY